MATASFSNLPTRAFSPSYHNCHQSFVIKNITRQIPNPHLINFSLTCTSSTPNKNKTCRPTVIFASGGGKGGGGSWGSGGGGGGGDDDAGFHNCTEAIFALAKAGRTLGDLPKDLAGAIEAGRVPAAIVKRYLELEKSPVFRWLLNFGGFRERLLADDLFLAKVAMECGVGVFTKVMAIIADFMLVWLPAPTISLRPPLAMSTGPIAKFFFNCPDNAFQVAFAGTSYSLLQRIGAIVVGVGITNALINARKALDTSFAGEAEDVPIISTSVAYGVYMAVSSNLRYQVLAGVIEQRILEPLLHENKIILAAICFAFRTGNTFLGSLMWVDYARWVGIQKIRE
ncbi:hypothetical protein KPL71_013626 [Citrus sinensis]|uniref:Uncharacterized protein n=1 Tax=Citrus sinensis TaxID=2711 RepID=A0ACB8LM19_CITSI|nr:hypothetical protein KPL71_013626 [Citrus sinensis]